MGEGLGDHVAGAVPVGLGDDSRHAETAVNAALPLGVGEEYVFLGRLEERQLAEEPAGLQFRRFFASKRRREKNFFEKRKKKRARIQRRANSPVSPRAMWRRNGSRSASRALPLTCSCPPPPCAANLPT